MSGCRVGLSSGINAEVTFADRLSDVLTERRLKQHEIAELAGVDQSLVSRYCNGKRGERIDLNALVRISDALGLEVDWLVSGRGRKWRGSAINYSPAFPELRKAIEFREGQYPAQDLQQFYRDQTERPGAIDHNRDYWDRLLRERAHGTRPPIVFEGDIPVPRPPKRTAKRRAVLSVKSLSFHRAQLLRTAGRWGSEKTCRFRLMQMSLRSPRP